MFQKTREGADDGGSSSKALARGPPLVHEMSIALSIADFLREEMEKYPGKALAEAEVSVGEFSGIDPGLLRSALEALAAEEHWNGVELNVRKAPLEAACKDCGCRFQPKPADFRCTGCGSGNVEVIAGQGLTIDSITLQ